MNKIDIRESAPAEANAIGRLYPDAFPDEDLRPLVGALLTDAALALSLVAVSESSFVGHGLFTRCRVAGNGDTVVLLGPLAVAAARRRQGIGSVIVRNGLARLKQTNVSQILVLGDPGYYRRFGFVPETSVAPPYPLPDEWREAWQSMSLRGAAPPRRGKLGVPAPWRRRTLWAP